MAKQQSTAQIARIERMRLAAKEGAEARASVAARDIAVRKNMQRLKALRLAKEADNLALGTSEAPKKKLIKKKKSQLLAS